jgi:superfamily II DNA/RNA helicase
MKPESQSYNLLGVTRSKAKMFEYGIPERFHIQMYSDPVQLFSLCIGIIGDYNIDNPSEDNSLTSESREKLLFAAQFFDSFIETKLDSNHKNYFLLVGSAAYYLVDLPGSASVLAKQITDNYDFECGGLDLLLIWLLQNDLSTTINFNGFEYSEICTNLLDGMQRFLKGDDIENVIDENLDLLIKIVYEYGTDRQLLFADIIRSIFRKRLYNSTRNSLKRYSSVNVNLWQDIMMKPSFVKEFWPAQKLLGEKGVFNGKSSIIQMPTSSGKTKAIEIIIRSSFLSGRSEMAVIIAPFRALCSEIKNSLQIAFKYETVTIDEPSDAIQPDFETIEPVGEETVKRILILTPEKFVYLLRTSPEISNLIGLLIYDEGHQFDNGIRGVTYELLLSSLKNRVAEATQIVLISAVISNSVAIGNWLINGDKEIISDKNLYPTYRTIAFASWTTALGQLQFIKNSNHDQVEYFVPRVIEMQTFAKKPRETTEKRFPEKNNGNDISIFLGLRLVTNGSVAIFCGTKATVKSLCRRIIDIKSRGYNVEDALKSSEKEEVNKLLFLHQQHFGNENIFSICASLGVFSHSSNTPEGLRLAIEYSLQSSKIRFVICTSTLAQGVNLPIRYLLITSFYQAGSKIKNRDFHNLIGRAGRSGMHTEGSIIFTDTELYDKKDNIRGRWKWNLAKDLLDTNKSEPCGSTLLTIFDSLSSEDKKFSIDISPLDLVDMYLNNPEELAQLPIGFVENHADKNFTVGGLSFQINYKIQIIAALESYIMAYWNDYDLTSSIENVDVITFGTLAYSLANEEQKNQLTILFRTLAGNINQKTTPSKRISYGRTLLGLEQLLRIEIWTLENLEKLNENNSFNELLDFIWPIIYEMSEGNLKKLTPETNAQILTQQWILGQSYFNIFNNLTLLDTKVIANTQLRNLDQEMIIDVCHSNFSYGITLVVAAICEVININAREENEDLISELYELQKMIKYGLPNQLAIAFYELGFSDRIIAIELATNFKQFPSNKTELIKNIITNEEQVRLVLEKYPSYFESLLDEMI